MVLQPDPALKFSNPVVGSAHGAVFVYTAKGRPEAIVSGFKLYAPARHMGAEFHSLSTRRISAAHDGKEVWYPDRAGVDLEPVPDAPIPADSAVGRLCQLRALADQFSASQTDEADITRDLRGTQPAG